MYTPTGNKLCTNREILYRQYIHKKHLNEMKSSVNNKPPRTHKHIKRNYKKKFNESENLFVIERDNANLLEKIYKIMHSVRNQPGKEEISYLPGIKLDACARPITDHYISRGRRYMPGDTNMKTSLHYTRKKQQYCEQVRNNVKVARRIHYSKPTLQIRKYEKEFDEKNPFYKHICQVDYTIGHIDIGNKSRKLTSQPSSIVGHNKIFLGSNAMRSEFAKTKKKIDLEDQRILDSIQHAKQCGAYPILVKMKEHMDKKKTTMAKFFEEIDKDRNNIVDKKEFEILCHKMGMDLTSKERNLILGFIDINGDEIIDISEFDSLFREMSKYSILKKHGTITKLNGIAYDEEDALYIDEKDQIENQWRHEQKLKDIENAKQKKLAKSKTLKLKLAKDENKDQAVKDYFAEVESSNDGDNILHIIAEITNYVKLNNMTIKMFFSSIDGNNDSKLSLEEIQKLCDVMKVKTTKNNLIAFMQFMDKDNNMTIEKSELDECIRLYKRFCIIQQKEAVQNLKKVQAEKALAFIESAEKQGVLDAIIKIDYSLDINNFTIATLFDRIDTDNSGYCNAEELMQMTNGIHLNFSNEEALSLLNFIDKDNGSIEVTELIDTFREFNVYMKFHTDGFLPKEAPIQDRVDAYRKDCKIYWDKLKKSQEFTGTITRGIELLYQETAEKMKELLEKIDRLKEHKIYQSVVLVEEFLSENKMNFKFFFNTVDSNKERKLSFEELHYLVDFHGIDIDTCATRAVFNYMKADKKKKISMDDFESIILEYRKFVSCKKRGWC